MSNADTAKLFFGVVLNKLQHAFPAAIFLSARDIWPEFSRVAKNRTISIKNTERSYQTMLVADVADDQDIQEHYTKLMLRWMAAEGFLVSDPASGFTHDYVLSSKALAALNIQFDRDKKTVGEMLATAAQKTGDAAQGELIARLVSKVFDYLQGLNT